jgi:hypothetical protein
LIFGFGWSLVLGAFFEAIDNFIMVSKLFIGVLGQKQVEKQVFGLKEYKP